VAERGHLDEQRQDQRDGAERPDVGAAHDVQRYRCGLAAAQAIGQISQAVQMHPPAEQGERRDRERCAGQRACAEWTIRGDQDNRGNHAEQQPDNRRPSHGGGRGRWIRRRPRRTG